MKRWMKITFIFLSLFLSIVVGVGIYLYVSVKSTADVIYEPRESVIPVTTSTDPEPKGGPVQMELKEPYTVLVLGVDERKGDAGRSDTMIVLSVNPSKGSILMFNIPRDTRTEIVGHRTIDKINHAYAFGGVNMSIQTVEKFLDKPMNYYIKLNMEGFSRMVDLLGGVEVKNQFTFEFEGHDFTEGNLKLNGAEALAYSRMRYDDPRGDFGRNARQREVLTQTIKNALQVSNVVRFQSMLDEVGNNVKTDITFGEMKKFITDYRSDLNRIETLELIGKGEMIDGIYFYMVEEMEKQRVRSLIGEHLQKAENP